MNWIPASAKNYCANNASDGLDQPLDSFQDFLFDFGFHLTLNLGILKIQDC